MEMGENSGMDIRRAFAKYANRILSSEESDNTFLDLGEEHGQFQAKNIRFRDAIKQGHLRIYVRQEAKKHPEVVIPTATVIALGAVAAGIYALKHRKKS